MIQENRELLLKDLCSRLPYGVIVKDRNGIHKLTNGNTEFTDLLYNGKCNIKPYLFPLSSMTLEQRCKVSYIIPEISIAKQKIIFYDNGGSVKLEQLDKLFNFFNLHHIDYRGLIEKGLANDATGLNIY